MTIQVDLDVYSGPMELLLELIKKNKIDIYDIPIAFVADEFLKSLETKGVPMDTITDFLVMAATLLEIKSKMLLPDPEPEGEEEEDPRLSLVEKILRYQAYKESAFLFKEMHDEEAKAFYRKPEEFFDDEDIALPEDGDKEDLARVFSILLAKAAKQERKDLPPIVREKFPVGKVIEALRKIMAQREQRRFSAVLSENPGCEEVISTFLAVLEMMKVHEITVDVLEEDLLLRRVA